MGRLSWEGDFRHGADGGSNGETLSSLRSRNGFRAHGAAAEQLRTTLLRITLGVTVLLLVVLVTVLSRQVKAPAAASPFQPGTCVSGPAGAASIASVACTGMHSARIDAVLNSPGQRCPRGDGEFAAVTPNPIFCLNYADHLP